MLAQKWFRFLPVLVVVVVAWIVVIVEYQPSDLKPYLWLSVAVYVLAFWALKRYQWSNYTTALVAYPAACFLAFVAVALGLQF